MKELGKAFSFCFDDPHWLRKMLIAALVMLLCLVGFGIPILMGYFVRITQSVMRRDGQPLPEWHGIGGMFVTGLKLCITYLVYLLPAALLALPLAGMTLFGTVADEPDIVLIIMTIYLFGFTVLLIPYSLAISIFSPIIVFRFAERESIGDAVDVVRVVRLFRENWQNALVVALIALGIQSVAPLGILVFGVGLIFTIFYTYAVSSYLSGLLFHESQAKREGA